MTDPASSLPPIHTIRGCKVILDADLAALYKVTTKAFNQAIRRNAARFPEEFIFQLTREDVAYLRSQIVTLKNHGHGRHRKYLPFVFTEHGAIMAAMVLKSERAVVMSVYVVRTFIRMRDELATSTSILKRLAEIDHHLLEHDAVLRDVYQKLLPLLEPPIIPPKRKIGFHEGNR